MVRSEKSFGAVVYYYSDRPYFLLLKNTLKKTYWEFPKGHANEGESMEEVAIRETKEETGLCNLQLIPGFKHVLKWFFTFNKELIHKEAVYLLIKISEQDKDKVRKSEEHQEICWLNFEDARSLLNIKSNMEMLELANKFIIEHEKQKTLF
jgi:8-oxo-dGTP pyrophosphatase MutT (NUDIX family)